MSGYLIAPVGRTYEVKGTIKGQKVALLFSFRPSYKEVMEELESAGYIKRVIWQGGGNETKS